MLVTFWMLSSYAIEVPTGAYDRAIEAIRRQTKELDSNPELVCHSKCYNTLCF